MEGISALSTKLSKGEITSQALIEQSFERIESDRSMGGSAFLSLFKKKALAEARLVDQARKEGTWLAPFSGIPLAIKDLFDVQDEVTRAGSKVLDHLGPARTDAQIVTNLRRAGFIIVGKNNMTEFAYSGLGVNAHFGTPLNPLDKNDDRVPGGSSSGAAVSVASEMVPAAIGTDTGGSCRIPAAFCGIVGFKPTASRVSRAGTVPLSRSLDSIGPIAETVQCCSVLDSVLTGGNGESADPFPVSGVRLGVLEGYVTEHMDEVVSDAHQHTLTRLSRAGVHLAPVTVNELTELPEINKKGGIVGAESYSWHRELLQTRAEFYDPWVRARFDAGQSQTAADYIQLLEHRGRIRGQVYSKLAPFDAFILPTVQIVPPKLSELATPQQSNAKNMLCLRNTSIGNFVDSPAISIPCHEPGSLPVGMMLMGMGGSDHRLFSIALGLEQIIRGNT